MWWASSVLIRSWQVGSSELSSAFTPELQRLGEVVAPPTPPSTVEVSDGARDAQDAVVAAGGQRQPGQRGIEHAAGVGIERGWRRAAAGRAAVAFRMPSRSQLPFARRDHAAR